MMFYFIVGFLIGSVLCYVAMLSKIEVLKNDNKKLWIALLRTVRIASFMESVKNVGAEVKK